MRHLRKTGFTLVEMAVVLTIIGLVLGGIMFGRAVITTSRLQSVMTDADNYITATANFRQTYQALPGDFSNANALWSVTNGNGDGKIGGVSGYEGEVFRFWQHLWYAGMFAQKLSGTATSGTYGSAISNNVPGGSIDGSGYYMIWLGTLSSDPNYFNGYYGHALIFGSVYTNQGTSGPVITADQASSIDAKVDDGMPGTGKVRAPISTSSITPNDCTSSAVASSATYSTSTAGNVCSLLFVTGF